jgi:hypothetical protein
MAGRPNLAGRARLARQPDPAGRGDDGAPPRPAPAPCVAWRGPRMVWTAEVGFGVPYGPGGLRFFFKSPGGPQSRGLLVSFDHQTSSTSNAIRCICLGYGVGG